MLYCPLMVLNVSSSPSGDVFFHVLRPTSLVKASAQQILCEVNTNTEVEVQ